jgi:hypothetical protein
MTFRKNGRNPTSATKSGTSRGRYTRGHAPGVDDADAAPQMFELAEVEALVQAAARAGRAMSYSETLQMLGMRFTRPKMRALCKVLDRVDQRAEAAGQPELAVLVVREGDGLPGQGWWVGRDHNRDKYKGPWEGEEASAYIAKVQKRAFRYWKKR